MGNGNGIGLVLFCIDTSDSESRRIFSGFLRSTRFAFLCTALRSEILRKFRQHFSKFCWIFTNFQSESAFFQPIFMKFHQNFTAISQNFSKFLKLVAIIFKIHEFWRIEGRGVELIFKKLPISRVWGYPGPNSRARGHQDTMASSLWASACCCSPLSW